MHLKRITCLFVFIIALSLLAGCAKTKTLPPIVLQTVSFDDFVRSSFNQLLARDPELAISLGLADQVGAPKDQLTDISFNYIQATQGLKRQFFLHLKSMIRSDLTSKQQIIYDTYLWYLQDQVDGQPYMDDVYPVTTSVNSIAFSLRYFLMDYAPVQSEADAQNYIKLLSHVGTKIEQLIDMLKSRQNKGVLLPIYFYDYVTSDIRVIAQSAPTDVIYYTNFASKLGSISNLDSNAKEQLLNDAQDQIKKTVIPAYKSLLALLDQQSRAAGNTIGAWSLPNGDAYYAYTLRHHTTTQLTADQIHDLGLQELESIHAQMASIFEKLGYPKDETLSQLYVRVAKDGGFVTGSTIQTTYEQLIQNAQKASTSLFNQLPRTPVIVKGDPQGGFYMPPSADGSRPGIFYAQTKGSVPRYTMPDLAYHEAVPGHHLQLALAGEMSLPLVQMVIELNGYVEGWALYAERLMWENGAYSNDPYGELGYLQMQARRAARLVIDTGINARKWTFNQAVDFMVEQTGLPVGDVQGEVSRGAVFPGQECSYYIGYLKILELRQKMQEAFGVNFSIKEFHDVILENGPVPLAVLENIVDEYIQSHH
jgi:uncharacterized protein (DUF885 family)